MKGFTFLEIAITLGLMAIALAGILSNMKIASDIGVGNRIIADMHIVLQRASLMSNMLAAQPLGNVTSVVGKYGGLPYGMWNGAAIVSRSGDSIQVFRVAAGGTTSRGLYVKYITGDDDVCKSIMQDIGSLVMQTFAVDVSTSAGPKRLFQSNRAVPVNKALMSPGVTCGRGNGAGRYQFTLYSSLASDRI